MKSWILEKGHHCRFMWGGEEKFRHCWSAWYYGLFFLLYVLYKILLPFLVCVGAFWLTVQRGWALYMEKATVSPYSINVSDIYYFPDILHTHQGSSLTSITPSGISLIFYSPKDNVNQYKIKLFFPSITISSWIMSLQITFLSRNCIAEVLQCIY